MNNRKTLTIVIVLIVVLLLSGLAATMLIMNRVIPNIKGDGSYNDAVWTPYSEQWELDLADSDQLEVDLININLEIRPGESDQLLASFEGYVLRADNIDYYKVTARQNSYGLLFRQNYRDNDGRSWFGNLFFNVGGGIRGTLIIELPQSFAGAVSVDSVSGTVSITDSDLRWLEIAGVTGNITAENITSADDIDFDSTSGHIKATNISAVNEIDVSAITGSVTLQAVAARSLELDSTSGNITVSELDIDGDISISGISATTNIKQSAGHNVLISTTSGAVMADGITAKSLHIDSISGRITAENLQVDLLKTDSSSGSTEASLLSQGDINCSSISGRIVLTVPPDFSATLNMETISGSFSCDLPLVISNNDNNKEIYGQIGSGSNSIKLETSSGNISINSAK